MKILKKILEFMDAIFPIVVTILGTLAAWGDRWDEATFWLMLYIATQVVNGTFKITIK